ncbi:MAG: hypothetical protein LBT10_05725 [Methanobrevibacter sp.]|jgi:hypothetical protein|nr:hypothetical protein [Methanobrevibacter sp.]
MNRFKLFLPYIPFLLFFIILLFLHQPIITHTSDDIGYAKSIDNLFLFNDQNFLFQRYMGWSSRIVTDFFSVILCYLPGYIWKFLDSILLVIASILMPKLLLNFKSIKNIYI